MTKIEQDIEYFGAGLYKKLEHFALKAGLLEAPDCFSDTARDARARDIQIYTSYLNDSSPFVLDGFLGPYHVELDYTTNRGQQTYIFHITSDAEVGERIIHVDAAPILEAIREDRQITLDTSSLNARFSDSTQLSPLEKMDRLKKMKHAEHAGILMDCLKSSGIDVHDLDFCKDLFAVLRVATPLDARMDRALSKLYDPPGF